MHTTIVVLFLELNFCTQDRDSPLRDSATVITF